MRIWSTEHNPFIRNTLANIAKENNLSIIELEEKLETYIEKFKKQHNKMLELAQKGNKIAEGNIQNYVESALFAMLEDMLKEGVIESKVVTDVSIFNKLVNYIRVINPAFKHLRDYKTKKYIRPIIVLVPSKAKVDPVLQSVTTAGALRNGQIAFNKDFATTLLNFAYYAREEGQRGYFESQGGQIPDYYAYIEFVIMHELLHILYGDHYHDKKTDGFTPNMQNILGDFIINYNLVKKGFAQLPMGLFSPYYNYDNPEFKTMEELQKKFLEEWQEIRQENAQNETQKTDEHFDENNQPNEGDNQKDNAQNGQGEDGESQEDGKKDNAQNGQGEDGESQEDGKKDNAQNGQGEDGESQEDGKKDNAQNGQGENGESQEEDKKDNAQGQGENGESQEEDKKDNAQGQGENGESQEENNQSIQKDNQNSTNQTPNKSSGDWLDGTLISEVESALDEMNSKTADEIEKEVKNSQNEDYINRKEAEELHNKLREKAKLAQDNINTDKELVPEFSWKELIKKMVGKPKKIKTSSYNRLHNRTLGQLPTMGGGAKVSVKAGVVKEINPEKSLLIVIDNSGSMYSTIAGIYNFLYKILEKSIREKAIENLIIAKFSGNYVFYQAELKSGKIYMYDIDVKELERGKIKVLNDTKQDFKKVMKTALGGGTDLSKELMRHIIKLQELKYNTLMCSDTDLLWADNKQQLDKLIAFGRKRPFSFNLILDTYYDYKIFVKKYKNYKYLSYFKD